MKAQFHPLRLALAASLVAMSWLGIASAAEPEGEAAAVKSSVPSDEQITKWVADLDSNQYRIREAATQQLVVASAAAIDPLMSAAKSKNPEPADRALWILRQIGQSPDRDAALAALSAMVTLRDRPTVVQEAQDALDRLREQICQETLSNLGGRLTVTDQVLEELGKVRIVVLAMDEHWHGTPDDLACLAKLGERHCFRLDGSAVGDPEVKMFASLDKLVLLQLFNTRVTPIAVDEIKTQNPKAMVYLRNRALFGIGGATHPQGVLVRAVQPGTAAADAGVMPGDVITQIDGQPLPDFDRLTARIAQHSPGDEIDVQILRGEDRVTKRAKLGTWPNSEVP
jgi:beta-phosphoglucomutase-like phosphatase (HAD superfamily)